MIEKILFGICVLVATFLTHKLVKWHRKKFDEKVVSYVLSNPDVQEKLRKFL